MTQDKISLQALEDLHNYSSKELYNDTGEFDALIIVSAVSSGRPVFVCVSLRTTKYLLVFIVHMALIKCLNSRMNTSTEFRPVFICAAYVASLHITTCCL